MASSLASCIFCKIVKGEIPSMKLLETETIFAFMDIGPIAKGHCLVIPKCWCSADLEAAHHAEKLTDLPDEHMSEILPALKKLAAASGSENYNILQNNGRPAHQIVDHVHFHMIPKSAEAGDSAGLVVGWPTQKDLGKDDIQKIYEEMKSKL